MDGSPRRICQAEFALSMKAQMKSIVLALAGSLVIGCLVTGSLVGVVYFTRRFDHPTFRYDGANPEDIVTIYGWPYDMLIYDPAKDAYFWGPEAMIIIPLILGAMFGTFILLFLILRTRERTQLLRDALSSAESHVARS